jgi:hypothetical protein
MLAEFSCKMTQQQIGNKVSSLLTIILAPFVFTTPILFVMHRTTFKCNRRRGRTPKETQVRVHLGFQKQTAVKLTPKSHTKSDCDVIYMYDRIISRSFQWHWSHHKIPSESSGIIEIIGSLDLQRCCVTNLLGLKPKLWAPHTWSNPTLGHSSSHKLRSRRLRNSGFVQFKFSESKLLLIDYNYGDTSFYRDPRPLFLYLLDCVH